MRTFIDADLTSRLIDEIRESGYGTASNGLSIGRVDPTHLFMPKVTALEIVVGQDPIIRRERKWYWLWLRKGWVRYRREIIGELSYELGRSDVNHASWVLRVYGLSYLAAMEELRQKLTKGFEMPIILRFETEKPQRERFLEDSNYV